MRGIGRSANYCVTVLTAENGRADTAPGRSFERRSEAATTLGTKRQGWWAVLAAGILMVVGLAGFHVPS
jgi:hypothetical protein